jgi:uncharacterized membrane protein YsdA (DUF1294 family)/cold shock CspA family protein
MRRKGKITTWNDDKGFGFIAPVDGGAQVFVHIKAFANRNKRPLANDLVTYSVTKDIQGRARAERATLSGDRIRRRTKKDGGNKAILTALLFLCLVSASVFITQLPLSIAMAYLVMSVVTFIAYSIDKTAAIKGRWRTSEGTLHLLALAGGWPGAMAAQQILRHKTKKASFRIVFWLTVVLNVAGFGWLHSDDGRSTLQKLLATSHHSADKISDRADRLIYRV